LFKLLSQLLKKESPSPSYPSLPKFNREGESNITGLYLAGDIAGKALIKVALNDGYELGNRLSAKLSGFPEDSFDFRVIVVGAGVAGVAAAVRLNELCKNVIVLESGRCFETLRSFTKGKTLFAEPVNIHLKGSIPFEENKVDLALEQLEDAVKKSGIKIREHTGVLDIKSENGGFRVATDKGEFTSELVVLCIGKSGDPRMAGVPGEKEYLEKISHVLADPEDFNDKNILIYGGGDVALEAALALCDNNRVTIAYRGKVFTRPKKRNVDALLKKEKEGRIDVRTDTVLVEIGKNKALVKDNTSLKETSLDNDHIFEMLGSSLPDAFFKKIGLKMEQQWDAGKWLAFLTACALVFPIYTWKKGFWPFEYYGQGVSQMTGILKNPSFWYSGLYTIVMALFGFFAMKRWSKKWTDTHQIARFTSLIAFQIISFVLIECTFAVFLPGDTWWRAYAVSNPFPLLFDSFYNLAGVSSGELKWAIALLAFLVTFVVIPVSVRWHGKRFCSWICGCGGLAETLGDRWRHLSPKGGKSRRLEIMGDAVLFWAVISAGVIMFFYNGNTASSGLWHRAYSVIADFWLIAIIPVALYPIMGGKIWCRYWCPLAKYMEILSRLYGKLAIKANDKCIQCTQCSRYCQVGVDVMAFAQNGESFSNKETSCIHCGICIAVCPMDVLEFERS
jgi:thioredoxin reductase/NAD-dependent dihydropyrimidine dehydrogenase PreA subunit